MTKAPFTNLWWEGLRGWLKVDDIISRRRELLRARADHQLRLHREFLTKELIDHSFDLFSLMRIAGIRRQERGKHVEVVGLSSMAWWGERAMWSRNRLNHLWE